jgi:hypothetical protein
MTSVTEENFRAVLPDKRVDLSRDPFASRLLEICQVYRVSTGPRGVNRRSSSRPVKHPDIAHVNAVGDIKRRLYRLQYVIIDHKKLGGSIDHFHDFSITFCRLRDSCGDSSKDPRDDLRADLTISLIYSLIR